MNRMRAASPSRGVYSCTLQIEQLATYFDGSADDPDSAEVARALKQIEDGAARVGAGRFLKLRDIGHPPAPSLSRRLAAAGAAAGV